MESDERDSPRIREMDQLLKLYRSQMQEKQGGLAGGQRNITLPLDLLDHIHLEKLAEQLGSSKTAVAVDILSAALRDLHVSLFGQSLSEQEINDYIARSTDRSQSKGRKEGEST